MQSISLSADWVSSKTIDSCLFVKLITVDDNSDQNASDSGHNEDIETLLESYENCVKLLEPITESEENSKQCKLIIKTKDETDEEFITQIHSFSMLCSAKVIEVHGNGTNEYIMTLINELVEELEGLSMFKSDYKFTQTQQEITLTLKGFKELWIYGLVVKLIRNKRKSVIPSKDVSSFAPIFNLISMFANSSQNRSSDDLFHKLSKLRASNESVIKNDVLPKTRTVSDKSDPLLAINENQSNASEESICKCLCHKNLVSDQNNDYLCQYIDKKVSDLEKSIENKFNALENKMFSVLNLFINKQ